MSNIQNLIDDTEKTHKNLGHLMAITQIVIKARKMMLVVSPSGCGKSTALLQAGFNTHGSLMPDKISIAGLAGYADTLTGFRSVIVVEDITTTQTEYARKAVITTLAALSYTHRIQTMMQGQDFTIEDFYGSALVGVQPIILRYLMQLDEWDGSIQDKALRYYHMYRPLTPSIKPPSIEYINGIDFDLVEDFEPNLENKNWGKLIELGYSQWSRARTVEHMKDYLKAIAALENRKTVIDEDYFMLANLLKPMAIENLVVVKEDLEGSRFLNNNLLSLLVEYYTYSGKFSLAQVALDYKNTVKNCYKIMASQSEYFQQISKSPTIYQVSKKFLKELKEYDLDIKQERMFGLE